MITAEVVGGLVVLGLALFTGAQAASMPYLVDRVPGPGFAPLWSAALMAVCGLGILAEVLRAKRGREPFVSGPGVLRVPVMVGVMGAGVGLAPYLGMRLCCGLVTLGLALAMGERRLVIILPAAVGAVLAVHLVFGYWLQVPFPRGLLGW